MATPLSLPSGAEDSMRTLEVCWHSTICHDDNNSNSSAGHHSSVPNNDCHGGCHHNTGGCPPNDRCPNDRCPNDVPKCGRVQRGGRQRVRAQRGGQRVDLRGCSITLFCWSCHWSLRKNIFCFDNCYFDMMFTLFIISLISLKCSRNVV